MRRLLAGAVIALALTGTAAALTAQQQKMKSCNADATQQKLTGEARKKFMSDCLGAKSVSSDLTPQQQKMKSCNAEAGKEKLTGDARKKFMSSCLSGN